MMWVGHDMQPLIEAKIEARIEAKIFLSQHLGR